MVSWWELCDGNKKCMGWWHGEACNVMGGVPITHTSMELGVVGLWEESTFIYMCIHAHFSSKGFVDCETRHHMPFRA